MPSWGAHYHAVASAMALYQQSNRRLIELAELKPGMTVVDLGCGSGLTSLMALDAIPEGLRLLLVDTSESMLETARSLVGQRADAFIRAPAEEFGEHMGEKVDRVLCNMAFWYFTNPDAVLAQARRIIKPTGRLCFNLVGTYFNGGDERVSPQWLLHRRLFERGLLSRAIPDPNRLANQRSIEGTLSASGFKPFGFQLQEIATDGPPSSGTSELANLLRLQPILSGETHQEAVRRSLEALDTEADTFASRPTVWRVAHFMAQPAISPDEAIKLHLGQRPV